MSGPHTIYFFTGSYGGDPVRRVDSAYIGDNGVVHMKGCSGTYRLGKDYCFDLEEARRLAKNRVDELIAYHQRHIDKLNSARFDPVGRK